MKGLHKDSSFINHSHNISILELVISSIINNVVCQELCVDEI